MIGLKTTLQSSVLTRIGLSTVHGETTLTLMHVRVFGFICVTLIFSGCVSSRKISDREPFYDYVGKTVELRRPVDVVGRGGVWLGGDGVMSRRSAKYGIVESGYGGQGRA